MVSPLGGPACDLEHDGNDDDYHDDEHGRQQQDFEVPV